MLKMQTPNRVKQYGLSALTAGFVFIAAPAISDASGFGSELLTDGIENNHVEKLQDLLIEEGHLNKDSANGVYNEATADAVTDYQDENDLLVDGMAGVQTLGALKVLGEGDENALVTDLQETLQDSGYYNDSADGYFDSKTTDAVTSFQTDADIAVDGLAGPETFGALYYGPSKATKEEAKDEEPVEEKPVEEEPVEEEAVEEETTEEEPVEEEAVEEETTEEEPVEEEAVEEEAAEEEPVEEEATEEETSEETASAETTTSTESDSPEGETYQMEATAYTANCTGCSGITATGIDLNNNRDKNVVAVDPNVIPLGSTVHVEGYGEAVAGDTGGDINGERIDLHVPTHDEAINFGRQDVEVTVLD
ncbi:3D (Asp-Asp-Asp) domain-containing protein/peptidoglycan hydrolase-like protein with peptidoglycan-binding domain [Geomicrobium halophilum]|uniref:3D (Asp-Asp-Asp) domain-containing protein/peptidoglycan hydrolase-like protein with peptidoglycan-binding domain n=1 Tax=Geomicrobium halophilum TaxID=549000 RepID=A0A841Q051_9BACL|nr:peptidoglycan-binding protein [Geomicrobium halophilum]MBB6450682.1 3D (Asp-Asp-Asp) domain-containing protein/peptidoglycan hydrolase-like protein with peptidoglycan-binding domain [Geomicrobium halophilum]